MSIVWSNSLVLAPMSKGSNLPFRRLCVEFGADITVSEMLFASALAKGNRKDLALLRRSPQERFFGVQVLTNNPQELREVLPIIANSGADFIDLNCGCPIDQAVQRGMGAQLLDRLSRLEQLLAVLKEESPLPFTVKLRSGYKEGQVNIEKTLRLVEAYGAAAAIIHGRTREQRYTGVADWQVVKYGVQNSQLPIIGNGDILTWYEAQDRQLLSGAAGLMVGRGALIKPWIFQEIKEKRDLDLSPSQRVAIYWQLTNYMLEHFGDDSHGQRTTTSFMSWHFDLFSRYRYLPESQYRQASREHPLIQTRLDSVRQGDPLAIVLAGYGKSFRQKVAQIFVRNAVEERPLSHLEEELRQLAPELLESYRLQAEAKLKKKERRGEQESASGLPYCDTDTAPQNLEAREMTEKPSAHLTPEVPAPESTPAPAPSADYGTPHIRARRGDFAPTVLMPGDPLRSRFIAENYLEGAQLVNNVRGVEGYTGLYKGKRVSVMASGMGGPSMGIYSHELLAMMGVERLIRIGTCFGLQPNMRLGSIVLAQGCSTNSNFVSQFRLTGSFAPLANFQLLTKAYQRAQELGIEVQVGNVLTSDYFYNAHPDYQDWASLGVLACEMEAAILYTNAALHGKEALAILTVSDLLGCPEIMSALERQTTLRQMIELALDLA